MRFESTTYYTRWRSGKDAGAGNYVVALSRGGADWIVVLSSFKTPNDKILARRLEKPGVLPMTQWSLSQLLRIMVSTRMLGLSEYL